MQIEKTLKEAAKLNFDNKTSRLPIPTSHWINSEFLQIQNFIEGAKWQAERMYSEKEMIEYGRFCVQCEKQGFIIPKNIIICK